MNKTFSMGIGSLNSSDGKVPTMFRVYIPPGTTSIGFVFYTAPYRIASVIRMGTPPEGSSLTKPVSMYETITATPWLMNNVISGGEYWSKNGDGHIAVIDGGGYIDQDILYNLGNKGRWLYVKIVNYESTWLQNLSFIMSVELARYTPWYNSMTEKDWACFNDPGNSIACSDNTSPTSYSVIFAAGAGGTISGITPQIVASGNSATSVTAKPNANYTFVNWTGPNGFTSTSNPLTVTNVTSNTTYTANFQQQPSVFQCDINGDNKLGLEEVIYILQVLAGLHP